MSLRIELLGKFALTLDGVTVTEATRARVQDLLAWLILHRAAPSPRRVVASALWPDVRDEQALKNLRTLLTRLRDESPFLAFLLIVDNETLALRLDSSCTVDLLLFEQARTTALTALENGDHSNALHALANASAHYGGDLLPGHNDEWIRPQRERLHHAWIDTLDQRARLLSTSGAHLQAQEVARQLLHADPLHESAYASLMRSQLALGDRAGALRSYHACAALLRDELGVDPGAETQATYESVLFDEAVVDRSARDAATYHPHQRELRTSSVQELVANAPMVGRTATMAWARERWQAACAGATQVLLLAGEAGIGKTRVVQEFASWIDREGEGEIAIARAYAAGATAYAPIAAWLRSAAGRRRLQESSAPILAETARLLPESGDSEAVDPLDEPWRRHRFYRALTTALLGERDAPSVPLLLILEDAQWADAETLLWLPQLLEAAQGKSLLLLLTLRYEESPENAPLERLLVELRRTRAIHERELRRLNLEETTQLAAMLGSQDSISPSSTSLAAALFRETEGIPLFIVETVRAGHGEVVVEAIDQTVAANALNLSPVVLATLRSRFDQVSQSAHELAECAAVLGREFRYGELAATSQADEETLVRALDELWRKRIVREQGADAYDFSHDKLRAVAYSGLSNARRRLLHRRAAEVMVRKHGDASAMSAQIAVHFEMAGRGDLALFHYWHAAEVSQQVFANMEAIRYYQRALMLLEEYTEEKARWTPPIQEQLADVHLLINQAGEAREAYQEAMVLLSPDDHIVKSRLQRKIGQTLRGELQFTGALKSYQEAEITLGAPPPDNAIGMPGDPAADWWREWIQLLLETEDAYYFLNRIPERVQLIERLREPVEKYGTPDQLVTFLQTGVRLDFARNRHVSNPQIVAAAIEALKVSEAARSYYVKTASLVVVGVFTLFAGDPRGSIAPLEKALIKTAETGIIVMQARALTYLALAHRQCQEVERAEHYAMRALEFATMAEFPEYVGTAKANLSWVAWRTGDLDATHAYGIGALEAWGQRDISHPSGHFQWTALFPLIALSLHLGEIEGAIGFVRRLLAPEQQAMPEPLVERLTQTLQGWDSGDSDVLPSLLLQVVTLAQDLLYL